MFGTLLNLGMTDRLKAMWLLKNVELLHFMEGRLRVCYEDLRHDDDVYEKVCGTLSDMPEIREFTINRTTGSVLIEYDPEAVQEKSLLWWILEGVRDRCGLHN